MHRTRKVFALRRQRSVFSFLFLLLAILFGASSIVFSHFSEKRLEINTANYMSLLNYQINVQIDSVLESINRISFMGTINRDLANTLRLTDDTRGIAYYNKLIKLIDFMTLSAWLNPYILSVTFVDNAGETYAVMGGTTEHLEYIRKNITLLEASGKRLLVTPIGKSKWFFSSEREIFTVVSLLQDPGSGIRYGYTCIDIDFKDFIRRILSELPGHQGNWVSIYQDSKVIYSNDTRAFGYLQIVSGKNINAVVRADSNIDRRFDFYKTDIADDEFLFVTFRNSKLGWVVVQYCSVGDIRNLNRSASLLYFAVITFLLCISILFSYIYSHTSLGLVSRLIEGMKRAERGEMIAIEHPKRGDYEIGQLIESFNSMVRNLRESIYRQYILKTEQKRAELRILQSQVNPHFLANTLYVIQSIARREDNKIIPRVTQNLISMFRYSIDGRIEVPVSEEIEQIKRYVEIQELRFPDRFSVIYDIDENVLDARMIKFVLQPLVENAFYHGIERTSRKGQIQVTIAEAQGEKIRIQIKDNGIGIEEGTLKEIREQLSVPRDKLDFRDETKWLGLKNVCFRIRDYYGDDYGLEISSLFGKETSVQVLIPKRNTSFGEHPAMEIIV